jgi:hypothetical protein
VPARFFDRAARSRVFEVPPDFLERTAPGYDAAEPTEDRDQETDQ